MRACTAVNCSDVCKFSSPDSDIAGIGVITAFVLSAVFTIAASLSASILHGDMIALQDVVIFKWRWKISECKKKFLIRVLDRFVLGFSDQQLVTGLSILIIGFIRLCSISTYHFYVITSLAMFSCSSHLASVLTLRRYFQAHPTVAKIRITVMLLFAFLLAVALIMGGAFRFNYSILKCPLLCTMHHLGIFSRVLGCLLSVYLGIAYWATLSFVFPNGEVLFTTWLIIKPTTWLEAMLGQRYGYQFQERFMHRRPYFIPFKIAFTLQLIWWIISLGISLLIRVKSLKVVSGSETFWGFGQMLAMLMLGLPVLNAVEIFFEQKVVMQVLNGPSSNEGGTINDDNSRGAPTA